MTFGPLYLKWVFKIQQMCVAMGMTHSCFNDFEPKMTQKMMYFTLKIVPQTTMLFYIVVGYLAKIK